MLYRNTTNMYVVGILYAYMYDIIIYVYVKMIYIYIIYTQKCGLFVEHVSILGACLVLTYLLVNV